MKTYRYPMSDHTQLKSFLQRSPVSIHQNLVINNQETAYTVERGEPDLVICEAYGFVFNQAFDLARPSCGEDDDNTLSCSTHFDTYLDGLVQDMVERQDIRNYTIVEVGCGKGHLLKKLVNYPGANNTGFGFDPSHVGSLTDLNGRLHCVPATTTVVTTFTQI
ncbi:hypothetical protein LH425_05610 [Laribacter hongkongensis]|uniref:hypothetical protein n=1 Tax=Laribacter hongkongensis TaxID=168471 RepID=UPI001EFEDD75|nr:hypothetical protein [Laribacter hongkongensis]MCG9064518.1 hypothetical protein [Laribacter hongkongensis]